MTSQDQSIPIAAESRFATAASKLQAMCDESVSDGMGGISAAIGTRDGVVWTGTAGVSDVRSKSRMQADMLLGIGSITKTFVAVVILQLVEEGRLSLHHTLVDVLGTAIRDILNANEATVAQLLNHTSGIASWEDDPAWIRDGRGKSLEASRIWAKTDPLKYVKGCPPLAAAGENYHYSNTNYTLLGMIIEEIAAKDATSEIRARILEPLGLNDTFFEGFEPVPPGRRLPRRYHRVTSDFCRDAGVNHAFPEVCPNLVDVSCSNLSVEWTAGSMVATARDLATFGAALRDGKLLNARSMEFMTRWRPAGPNIQVGHNVFRKLHRERGRAVIGHNGGVLGFTSSLYWIEGADAVVAVMCNVGSIHTGLASAMLRAMGMNATTTAFIEAVLAVTSS